MTTQMGMEQEPPAGVDQLIQHPVCRITQSYVYVYLSSMPHYSVICVRILLQYAALLCHMCMYDAD